MKGSKAPFQNYGAKPQLRDCESNNKTLTQNISQDPNRNTSTQREVYLRNKGAEGPF